jgi:hypothetical protein
MDTPDIKDLQDFDSIDLINAAVQDDGGVLVHLSFEADGTPYGVVAFDTVGKTSGSGQPEPPEPAITVSPAPEPTPAAEEPEPAAAEVDGVVVRDPSEA